MIATHEGNAMGRGDADWSMYTEAMGPVAGGGRQYLLFMPPETPRWALRAFELGRAEPKRAHRIDQQARSKTKKIHVWCYSRFMHAQEVHVLHVVYLCPATVRSTRVR